MKMSNSLTHAGALLASLNRVTFHSGPIPGYDSVTGYEISPGPVLATITPVYFSEMQQPTLTDPAIIFAPIPVEGSQTSGIITASGTVGYVKIGMTQARYDEAGLYFDGTTPASGYRYDDYAAFEVRAYCTVGTVAGPGVDIVMSTLLLNAGGRVALVAGGTILVQ